MKFETPTALWALCSLVLLVLFSLWRQAAQKATVPSLLLWKQIPERNPPVRALRRPKWKVELLLQALAIAALAAALAGPYLESEAAQPRRIALVFDTSARMRAGDRLAKAKAFASGLKLTGDEVSCYDSSPAPRRFAEISAAKQSDVHIELEPLLAAARASADHVLLFTDRPVPGVPLALFGAADDNSGIVAFSVTDEEVFVRLARHGPPRPLPIELLTDGVPVRETVPADGLTWSHRGDYSKASAVRVSIDAKDSFPMDDVVEAVRLGAPASVVTLAGRPHEALAKGFRSIPGVTLLRGDAAAALSLGWDDEPGKADLRIRIHSPAAPLSGEVAVAKHPLTVDLEGRGSELASAGLGEVPAAYRTGTPLIKIAGKTAAVVRGQEVHLCIDLNRWQSQPSFPIFLVNALDHARKGRAGWLLLRTGVPAALPAGSTVEQAPDGALQSLAADGSFLAHSAGDYRIRTPEGLKSLRVNLLDDRESDTAGVTRAPDWDPAAPVGRIPKRRDLGGMAAGAAFLFLLLAWLMQLRAE